jgi:hypothetical protein
MPISKADYKYRVVVTYPAKYFPTYETPIKVAVGRHSDAGGCDSGDKPNAKSPPGTAGPTPDRSSPSDSRPLPALPLPRSPSSASPLAPREPLRDKSWFCVTKAEAGKLAAKVRRLKLVGVRTKITDL